MVKQVKTKTTLKARHLVLFIVQLPIVELGTSSHLPIVRRRVDVPSEKCVVQNGIERNHHCTKNKNHCV